MKKIILIMAIIPFLLGCSEEQKTKISEKPKNPEPSIKQPTAPTINPKTAIGDGQLTLFWEIPSNNGGSAITHYEYNEKEELGGSWSGWQNIPNSGVGEANEKGFIVTGLTNEINYFFKIRAVNSYRPSDPSEKTKRQSPVPVFEDPIKLPEGAVEAPKEEVEEIEKVIEETTGYATNIHLELDVQLIDFGGFEFNQPGLGALQIVQGIRGQTPDNESVELKKIVFSFDKEIYDSLTDRQKQVEITIGVYLGHHLRGLVHDKGKPPKYTLNKMQDYYNYSDEDLEDVIGEIKEEVLFCWAC